MTQPNPQLESYFAKPAWQAEALALRALALSCGLEEERKWSQPCYTLEGRNVVILHRMKAAIGFGFFNGALLDDPEGILEKPGENSNTGRRLLFASLAEIQAAETTLRRYLEAAKALARSGQKVTSPAQTSVPPELAQRLADDADLAAAFAALTPGRQRAYCLFIGGAKQSATRSARIDKHFARILEGKGPNDR